MVHGLVLAVARCGLYAAVVPLIAAAIATAVRANAPMWHLFEGSGGDRRAADRDRGILAGHGPLAGHRRQGAVRKAVGGLAVLFDLDQFVQRGGR